MNKSGEITVSVTVKDSRGFSVTKSEKINVLDYSAPTVSVNSIYRCDENGNKTTLGTYLLCDYDIKYSALNQKNTYSFSYKYKKADGDAWSGEIVLSDSPCVIGGDFLNSSSYIIAFKVNDRITTENDFIESLVPSADIPFNIRKGGKGASFGCYAERDNELTVGWNLNVKGSLVYEYADIALRSSVTDKRGLARYFPCLEIVIVRLRFTATQTITSGENHIIATFTNRTPTLATPISVIINNGVENKCTGYIKAETGDLVMNSGLDIEKGDYIYVSGFFFAYRE